MEMMNLKQYMEKHPKLKQRVYQFIMHPIKTRPYGWTRLFRPFYMKRGKGSVIYSSVRKDIIFFHPFYLGDYSIIEDFSCINNAVGEISIGHHTRIGLHNTIIGPVHIGNHVNLAQGVVVSGLNHNYQTIDTLISKQGVSTSTVTIKDDVWIGANATITAGVTIGKHVIVGAGSVVTKDVPDYCVIAGNPARIIKRYNFQTNTWNKVKY